jgi:membrane carboxypeptidase/penicillin-binding protein
MALGANEVTPLQLAAAYATFANGGRRVEPTFIDKIVSVEDEILYGSSQENEQIVSPRTAYMITDMLRAVVERGTARRAAGALGKEVVFAGKTGSSKDGWFVGYTPNLVTVAWIGVDDNEDIHSTGGEIALPLWVDYMKSVVGARPEFGGEYFPMPRGLSEVTVDPETGMIADVYCPQKEKVVVPYGAVSGINCFKHQPLPEPFSASIEEPEISPTPNESDISAIIVEDENFQPEPETKQVKSAPPEKVEKSDREPQKLKLKKTYLEDFENQKPKTRMKNNNADGK